MRKIKKLRQDEVSWIPHNPDHCEDSNLYHLLQEIDRLYDERAWRTLGSLILLATEKGSILEGEAALRLTYSYVVDRSHNGDSLLKSWRSCRDAFKGRLEDRQEDIEGRLAGILHV